MWLFLLLIHLIFNQVCSQQLLLTKLNKPENLSKDEWRKYIEKLEPKFDNIKTSEGKKQPDSSGKVKTATINGHIIGGTVVSSGQLPWQVSLFHPNDTYFCGGTLISENFILTAAHCVQSVNKIKVVLGNLQRTSKYEDGRFIAELTQIFIHPKWNISTLSNNIALLKLPISINVSESENINSIRLPKLSDQNKTMDGVNVTFSGWGKTQQNGEYSEELNKADTNVIQNLNCAKYYGTRYVQSSTLCTAVKVGKISACFGDGGGPLIYRETDGMWTIIGVISFVSKSGCTAGPTGYTRVSSYLNWISTTANINLR